MLGKRPWRTISSYGRGGYFPLFFFDEAVALAAGHRPCGHCRPNSLAEFKRAWGRAIGHDREPLSVRQIDNELHRHRRAKSVTVCAKAKLPSGVFLRDARGNCYLLWDRVLLLWGWSGYSPLVRRPAVEHLTLLTPAPIIDVLASGYRPLVHSSIEQTSDHAVRSD